MARSNRVSVPHGIYHVTSRVIGRLHAFADSELKDRIVEILYDVAAFSGIDLLDWCVMDNHFHLFIEVPMVPEMYWTDPGVEPDSYAFGMRPPECNAAIWEQGGDAGQPQPASARPATGFTLPDDEMARRLGRLYHSEKVAAAKLREWSRMRAEGLGSAVDAAKDRYCRRMYNLSQFVKTFKERIVKLVRDREGFSGPLFEGRFWSGLVEESQCSHRLVSLYIDFNPYKAGLVKRGEVYRWSSFGQAMSGGKYGAMCRQAYERMYGMPWEQVKERILAAFAERLPEGEGVERKILGGKIKATIGQLIKIRCPMIAHGAYISDDVGFPRRRTAGLPQGYRRPSALSLVRLNRILDWRKAS